MIRLRIKEIAKTKGLPLGVLASRVGVTPQTLSGFIAGRFSPSFDTLERLASALGVSVSELFAPPASPSVVCPHCGRAFDLEISPLPSE